MKYLLLTDIPPCENYTAGLVLNRLVQFLPKDEIVFCAVINPNLKPIIPEYLNEIQCLVLQKPSEYLLGSKLPILGGLLSFLHELIQAIKVRVILAPKIANFAKIQNVDRIWVVLQGQTMVRLAHYLPKMLSCPLYTQVWDPFGWWLRANKINFLTKRNLLKQFSEVISQSVSCATASWDMSNFYSEKYGIKNNPVIAGLPEEYCLPPATKMHEGSEFIIGMAGQIYASDEWNSLILALNNVGWTINGRNVRIRLLGESIHLSAQLPLCIEYLGWRSQKDTINLLEQADVLYLPYWFKAEFDEECRNSFPSKLVTYFASGRPVMCHSPKYASPAKYIFTNNAGYLCNSMLVEDIIDTLSSVESDKSKYEFYSKNGASCFKRDFTLGAMKASFQEFLGKI